MPDTQLQELPWASNPYSIKQHGLTINNCDQEPVQTPGCIQAYGAMLVARCTDLTVVQASENLNIHLGIKAQDALQRRLDELLGLEFLDQIVGVLSRGKLEANPVCVSSYKSLASGSDYDVIVHTTGDLLLVEFVPAIQNEAQRDYYELVKIAVGRLQAANTLSEFSERLAHEVREITGLDRAMIYRFHRDFHGEVFAESRRDDLPSWKGLHYPAEDIPQPAREVFQRIWVRPVPHIDGELAEMVPLANPDTGKPLLMTHCVLRGASVMYTEYLRNMRVTAALTMSLRDGDQLWGMIACHHYEGPRALNVQARSACELLAQIASLLIRKIEEREHLIRRLAIDGVHQQILARAAVDGDLRILVEGTPSLLSGIPAGGIALRFSGRWWTSGETPDEDALEELAEWLSLEPQFSDSIQPIFETDSLSLVYSGGRAISRVASGILAIPVGDPRTSLLIWFRPETIQTIHWAGSPHDKPTVPGPNGARLTPRASFALFVESVKGRSLPWSSSEVSAASQLRHLIQNIVVGRAEQIANLNSQLLESNEELDAFAHIASHDLREPLRGIYKYGHQLLKEAASASEEERSKLERLMRLTARMDSLLESLLHYSRVGRTQLLREEVDLNEVLQEAIEALAARIAERPNVQIVIPRSLPQHSCDPIRLREIFANLLSNALKYTNANPGLIEVGYLEPGNPERPSKAPSDSAAEIIFYVKDNGIGIAPHHHEHIFELFRRLHTRNAYGGGTGAGLTIVKRAVERHGGHIWVVSQEGAGSVFYFTLPRPRGALPPYGSK